MGPDIFLTNVHSLINSHRRQCKVGTRHIGVLETVNLHVGFFSPLTRGPGRWLSSPVESAQGRCVPRAQRSPSKLSFLSSAISSGSTLIPSFFLLFPAPFLSLESLVPFAHLPHESVNTQISESMTPAPGSRQALRGCVWTVGLRARQEGGFASLQVTTRALAEDHIPTG